MKKLIFVLAAGFLSGCATVKTVDQALAKAAAVATGPCGIAITEAITVCQEQKFQP